MSAFGARRAAVLDAESLVGSAFARRTWSELGVDPCTQKVRWRSLFDARFPGFRRLDTLSKLLCVTAEAAGLTEAIRAPRATALVFATATGCLTSDHEFQRSLAVPSGLEAGLFPYTLPSTPLCELAIRYGLQGPTICLSVATGGERAAFENARLLLEGGEASACLVCLGDWLAPATAAELETEPATRLGVILVESVAGSDEPIATLDGLCALSPWAQLAALLDRIHE